MKCLIGQSGRKFLSEKMFGLFFEDINYAADGGLYAEMLENRQFAFRKACPGKTEKTYETVYAGEYGWQKFPADADAEMSFLEGDALCDANPHYMNYTVNCGEAGFTNKAYDGICMKNNGKYLLTVWLRSRDYSGSLKVCILDESGGRTVAFADCRVEPGNGWKQYTLSLTATDTVKNGVFLLCQERGSLDYGYLSLMPENAVEGIFREDLFEMLKAMEPGFLRFPGGCIVEGACLDNRYRWKDTVGLPWERKWNWSRWAVHDVTMGQGKPLYYPFYNQSYGIGFYEYFLLSELIGAKPLPVLSVGLACQFQSDELVPMDAPEFREYLQDALDLIEFANGETNTKWGAVRARMGHPAPFGLEYIGIGNEQWETPRVDFFDRYRAFEKAVHEKYPEIRLIGSAGPDVTTERYTKAWEFYREECGKNPDFTHAVDEHYYMPPAWFYEHVNMYDDYSREVPVFAGEYAAHCERKQNNWEAALAEAAFMCGLERNGDVIRFASSAPLFARKDYVQWIPDTIWFDGDTVMGTPGYYVQKLFGVYTGSESLDCELQGAGKNTYLAVSADQEKYYIKLIHAHGEQQVLEQVYAGGHALALNRAQIFQMSASAPEEENVLGGKQPISLQPLCGVKESLTIPAWSCTVIVADR